MDWTFFLLDILPLLAFVVVDSLSNLKTALIAALAVAGLEVAYDVWSFGRIDEFTVISVLLVAVFGGLSLRFDNRLYFKFKPVVLSVVTAAALLVTCLLDRPLLVMAMDRYGPTLPESMRLTLQQPQVRAILERASLYLGFGFLLHAGAVAWAALRLGNWGWFAVRSVGAYAMMLVVMLLAMRG